jgi:hypothetical protein
MEAEDNKENELPQEETVKVGESENGTPATTSEGEYSEEKKTVMSAMKSHYGEDVSDEEYVPKLEKMVAGDLLPKAEKLGRYDESNERIMAMMDSEPELGGILSDMSRGGKFLNVLPKYVDVTSLEPEGEDDMQEWADNVKAREENYRLGNERKASIAANLEKSEAAIEEFITGKNIDEPGKIEFAQKLADFLDKAYSGEITKEFLDAMYYYMNRDTELENQRKVGELAGANKKISQQFASDAEIRRGDQMPALDGSAKMPEQEVIKDPIASTLNKHLDGNKSILNG